MAYSKMFLCLSSIWGWAWCEIALISWHGHLEMLTTSTNISKTSHRIRMLEIARRSYVSMSPMKSENKWHFEKVNVEVQNFYIFTHKKSKYQKRRHYLLIEIQRLYSLEVSSSCIRNQCREKLFPVKILVWSWNLPFLTRIKDVEAWLS